MIGTNHSSPVTRELAYFFRYVAVKDPTLPIRRMGTDADAADADAIIAGGGGEDGNDDGSPSASTNPPPSSSSSSSRDRESSVGNIGGGGCPFLAPEDLCGRTLLGLVCRGHSICADVRMLSERVPDAFLAAAEQHSSSSSSDGGGGGKKGGGSSSSSSSSSSSFLSSIFHPSSSGGGGRAGDGGPGRTASGSPDGGGGGGGKGGDAAAAMSSDEAKNYSRFLFDFTYLHNPEEWEAGLSSSSSLPPPHSSSESSSAPPPTGEEEDLLELEREFAINHRSIIEEYYDLFYSIYEYQKDLNEFAEDLSEGYYIQYTVESVLLDADGRALLCEAIWLYGVMLMLMERFLPVSFRRVCSREGPRSRTTTTTTMTEIHGVFFSTHPSADTYILAPFFRFLCSPRLLSFRPAPRPGRVRSARGS